MVDNVIRLFEATDTSFISNGIGYLTDATECGVSEERNGAFELTMKYPITGIHYKEIQLRRIIVAKPNPYDDPQPFRIYQITKPMKKLVTIHAEHIRYDMSGYPVSPFTASNVVSAFEHLKANSVTPCPFTFWTDKATSAEMNVEIPTPMTSLLGGVQGSILDIYGGEYQFDKFLVRLYGGRGADRGVTIRYGKNLTDVEQDENCASVYTGVYPYWAGTIQSEDGETEESVLVLSNPAIVPVEGTFNFTRILMLDCGQDFQELPTPEQLKARAERYISENKVGVPKVSINVSFVDLMSSLEYEELQLLETVHLCDTVTVEFEELGVKATSKCVKTDFDVLTGTYRSITLGETRGSIASTIVSGNQETKSEFEKMIEREKYLNDRITITLRDEFGRELKATKDELGNQIVTVQDNLGNDIQLVVDDLGNVVGVMQEGFKNTNVKIETVENEFGEKVTKVYDDMGNEIATLYTYIDEAIKNLKTQQQEAIDHATKLITGNLGGNVVLHSSTGGDSPDELLIMDTNSISTAKKIWRWNLSGLGYSSKGYNGPYALAMTNDGVFVADFIQAGTMSANRIKGGTLILGGANNGNGTILVNDASGKQIGKWDNTGIAASGDFILEKVINKVKHTVKLGEVSYQTTSGRTETSGGMIIDNGYSIVNDAITGNGKNGPLDGLMLNSGVYNNHWIQAQNTPDYFGIVTWRKDTSTSVGDVTGGFPLRVWHKSANNSYPKKAGGDVMEMNSAILFRGDSPYGMYTYAIPQSSSGWGATFVSDATFGNSSYYRLYRGTSSTIRIKDVDRDMIEDDISKLYQIQPVFAKYKNGILAKTDERVGTFHPMFIAEDIDLYFPEAVDHDEEGLPENWNFRVMIPAMFQMIKSQKEHIDILEKEVAALKELITQS